MLQVGYVHGCFTKVPKTRMEYVPENINTGLIGPLHEVLSMFSAECGEVFDGEQGQMPVQGDQHEHDVETFDNTIDNLTTNYKD